MFPGFPCTEKLYCRLKTGFDGYTNVDIALTIIDNSKRWYSSDSAPINGKITPIGRYNRHSFYSELYLEY